MWKRTLNQTLLFINNLQKDLSVHLKSCCRKFCYFCVMKYFVFIYMHTILNCIWYILDSFLWTQLYLKQQPFASKTGALSPSMYCVSSLNVYIRTLLIKVASGKKPISSVKKILRYACMLEKFEFDFVDYNESFALVLPRRVLWYSVCES